MWLRGYDRFAEVFGGNQAADRVRGQQLPKVGPTLDYLDEAFTSENWIVCLPYFLHGSISLC